MPDDLALAANADGSGTAIAVGSPVMATDANSDSVTFGLKGAGVECAGNRSAHRLSESQGKIGQASSATSPLYIQGLSGVFWHK